MNQVNLRPVRTKSEARTRGRSGGLASGEARRARITLRAALEELLAMPVKDESGIETGETMQHVIAVALIEKALKGDTKAFEIIRDTIGEKPVERITMAEIDPHTIDQVERMVLFHASANKHAPQEAQKGQNDE
ncbi:MAG: hypothetical protein IKO22_04220 [Oscillospiraceae bacterium]|nr:hypothetical protein [Oscillospiraceae bacterium]